MEKDELGLNWYDYGARMYDAVVGRWMVVDRYSEKYLSISGYTYVSNNPTVLIDPTGDTVKYKNESTEAYVKQFTSKTIINRKGKEVRNALYSEDFAKIIEALDKSERVYEFNDQYTSDDPQESGAISTDGEKVFVGFSEPSENYGSKSNSLFEETYHAFQVEKGTLSIDKLEKGYGFRGFALEAEYAAKKFAANAPLTKLNYLNPEGLKIETQMSLIKTLDPIQGRYFLTHGYSKQYINSNGGIYTVKYDAPYSKLKRY